MNIQDWFPLALTGLISLQFKGLSRVFSNNSKASVLQHLAIFIVQLSQPYMTTGKTIALTRWTFVGKVMSLLFNMLSSWSYFSSKESFNFKAAITIHSEFGAQENKVCHRCHCFPIYLPWSDGTECHDLSFLNVEFQGTFSLSSFTFIKKLFGSSSLSAMRVLLSTYLSLFTPVFRFRSPFEIFFVAAQPQNIYWILLFNTCLLYKVDFVSCEGNITLV